jgi:hypothetical protein
LTIDKSADNYKALHSRNSFNDGFMKGNNR